jgi:hypothetical protein
MQAGKLFCFAYIGSGLLSGMFKQKFNTFQGKSHSFHKNLTDE